MPGGDEDAPSYWAISATDLGIGDIVLSDVIGGITEYPGEGASTNTYKTCETRSHGVTVARGRFGGIVRSNTKLKTLVCPLHRR